MKGYAGKGSKDRGRGKDFARRREGWEQAFREKGRYLSGPEWKEMLEEEHQDED